MRVEIGNYTQGPIKVVMANALLDTFGEVYLPVGKSVLEHPDLDNAELVQDGVTMITMNTEAGTVPSRVLVFLRYDGPRLIPTALAFTAQTVTP